MQVLATSTAPSKQVTSATSQAKDHCSSACSPRPSAAAAASQAAAVTASAISSISAHRCLTAWKEPILRPNCSRTPAYATAVRRHQRATPAASAAARVTASRRTVASSVATGSPAGTSPSTPARRDMSSPVDAVAERASAEVSTQPSSPRTSAWAVEGASRSTFPSGVGSANETTDPPASAVRPASGPVPRPARASTPATTAGPSSGPATSSAAQASRATAWSRVVPPPPPTDSGTAMVARPISTTPFQTSSKRAPGSPSAARAASTPPTDAAQPRRLSASPVCSSEMPIDMEVPSSRTRSSRDGVAKTRTCSHSIGCAGE